MRLKLPPPPSWCVAAIREDAESMAASGALESLAASGALSCSLYAVTSRGEFFKYAVLAHGVCTLQDERRLLGAVDDGADASRTVIM